jgi:hypothetical protein
MVREFSKTVYFISEHSYQEYTHGGIGPVDIETILLRNRAIPIRFPFHFDFSLKAKIARLYHVVKLSFVIGSRSVVIFQHPLYARIHILLLKLLRLKRSVTVVCLVTDIDGLKAGDGDLLQREKAFFKKYKYFILHNPAMEEWLKAFHPTAICSLLTCFDFLAKESIQIRSKSHTIVFAGNLQKSKFLERLDLWLEKNGSLFINLYGPYVNDAMLKDRRVSYMGLYTPYELPDMLEGSFGLIWDGEGIQHPEGSLGNYMQYISHHKLSLYIVSNLPVILYENAGSAEMVKKFNIGFTVKGLFEIEDKINKLSDEDYNKMVQNTHDLAREITSGNCLAKALGELLMEKNRSINS